MSAYVVCSGFDAVWVVTYCFVIASLEVCCLRFSGLRFVCMFALICCCIDW